MSFKNYELAMKGLERYKKLCDIKVGNVINEHFTVLKIYEYECNFLSFKVSKFGKIIYEKDVIFL